MTYIFPGKIRDLVAMEKQEGPRLMVPKYLEVLIPKIGVDKRLMVITDASDV